VERGRGRGRERERERERGSMENPTTEERIFQPILGSLAFLFLLVLNAGIFLFSYFRFAVSYSGGRDSVVLSWRMGILTYVFDCRWHARLGFSADPSHTCMYVLTNILDRVSTKLSVWPVFRFGIRLEPNSVV
jgi:hypothetical protein